MEQSFKRIADSVCLSESSRTRIRAQIAFRAEEQEASMQNNSKKHLPRLAVAAIIIAAALTLTAAAAAVVHRFRNDIIVTSVNELPEPTEDTPMAVAVVTGRQRAAQTPEDVLDDRFVEACQMLDYVEYLADLLIAAELEQRVKIVEMLNKDGMIAGLEERLDRLKKEDGAYEKQNAA